MKLKEMLSLDAIKRGIVKVGRRNWIILGALLLIAGAVYLNWSLFAGADDGFSYDNAAGMSGDSLMGESLSGDTTVDNTAQDDAAYFAATQVSRQRARDEAMEVLRAVVDSEDAVETVKGQALSDITRIALDIEREANIETLITSKGFAQCVAVINGDTANIIVKSDGLLPNEIAQINEIVYEQAGILPANVKIIEKST
ncbi:MAG: SpoIIIAH-like family protein [Clostridia bacterium]|nr:SpoIIIAH-like family protein [Clostridia bacterium]